jgi:hypothetical protein
MSKSATKINKPKKGKSKGMKKSTGPSERDSAIIAMCNRELIADFDNMTSVSFGERCAGALNMYTLESINVIQEAECHEVGDRNAFPSDEYILLNDKMNPKSSNRSVTRKGDDSKISKPRKNHLPPKKGQKILGVVDVVDVDVDVDDDDVDDVVDEKISDKKPKNKKNITQVQKGAKIWLQFLANRFVYEIYSTAGGTNITSDDDFAEFVLKNVTTDFSTHMSKVVIAAVQMRGSTVRNMSDHKLQPYMSTVVDAWFDKRSALANTTARFLVTYLKLLGSTLGIHLWHRKGAITASHIEAAMRVLDYGADQFYVDNNVCSDGGFNAGLHTGILKQAREFEETVNPPISEEVKAERAYKRVASKAAKKVVAVAVADDDDDDADADADDDDVVVDDDDDEDDDDDDDDDDEEEEEEEAPIPKTNKKVIRKIGKSSK